MRVPVEILILENHLIKLYDESDYSFGSSDNRTIYNNHYFNGEESNVTSLIGIEVLEEDVIVANCLIGASGGNTTIHPNSALISYGGLVVCCSNTVFKLTLPDLCLEWKTQSDLATCFGIHYLDEDYAVHGELAISRMNKNGQLVWQRSGRDIWITLEGIDDFEMYEDHILATDWQYNRYKWGFNGDLLEEYKIEPRRDHLSKQQAKWWEFWK